MANVYNRDVKAMAEALGVDTLNFLSPMGLLAAVKEANATPHGYCTACFTGEYPVPVNLNVNKEENELV
jgi:amidophosphoribosyltransferase